MKEIIFDRNAVDSLKHDITHLEDCLRYMPKSIKSIKWECEIFKREMSMESSLDYINKKLVSILEVIKLAEERPSMVESQTVHNSDKTICPECEGSGEVADNQREYMAGERYTCPKCSGTGHISRNVM